MKIIKSILFSLWALLIPFIAGAQAQGVAMADGLRAEGKIYVVVGIIAIIFIGILIYLISMDRKISRLEKEWGNPSEE
ncbi:MAG: CcmD family protein [Cyclobacteriaceae bacterium]|nr:CcmD family protein [Cyclobacteriaceae bacterium]